MSVKFSKKYKKFREKKLEVLSRMKEKFFDTVAKHLHHKSSYEVIFSRQCLVLLKEALPTAESFLKMTASAREKVVEKIENIMLIESDWKALVSKQNHEQRLIERMYPEELKKFQSCFEMHFNPAENIIHKQIIEKYPSSKVKALCKGLFKFLQSSKVPFLKDFPFKEIDDSKLNLIADRVAENTNSSYFFKDIVKICMKKALDNRINVETAANKYTREKLDNPFLFVKRTHIMYPLQEVIVMYYCIALLEALKDEVSSFDLEVSDKIIFYLNDLFKKNEDKLMKKQSQNDWYRDTYNISVVFLGFFVQSGLVVREETIKQKGDKYESVVYWLNHSLENTVPFPHHIPRIIPPKKIDLKKNMSQFMSPYTRGDYSFSPSQMTIKALNLAQSKAFKVNEIFLNFQNEVHNNASFFSGMSEKGNVNLPTVVSFAEKFHVYSMFRDGLSVNALQRYINKKATAFLYSVQSKEENAKNTTYLKSLNVAGVTQVESELNYNKRLAWEDFSIAKAARQILQTSLIIAKLFIGFPIYYGTKLDFRTRMYPWEYLLSRTTGELKQLLCDFNAQPVTLEGCIALLTAYYNFSMNFSVEWHEFLVCHPFTTDTVAELMAEFFKTRNYQTNPEEFDCDNQLAYVLTLHMSLLNIFESKDLDVDIFVEIDQVASGVMFLAILLGIGPLAEKTNLLNDKPVDIYRYIMGHTEEFFNDRTEEIGGLNDQNTEEFNTVVSFLSTNRACNKSVLMTWAYSQGPLNRSRQILLSFKERHGRSATDLEYKLIKIFANRYEDFLESLFPKIKQQKDYMKAVLDIRIKAGTNIQGVSIRSLEGSGMAWGIKPTDTITKGVYDPVAGKSFNVSIKTGARSSSAMKQMKDDYHRGLFPNLIHSIDASIMRLIILGVWEKNKYIINHLHDCILCHPNYVTTVHEVITEIYTGGILENLADKVFFLPMKDGLSADDMVAIETIRKEFNKNRDELKFTRKNFVSENSYTFEGSVKRDILASRLEEKGLKPALLLSTVLR